MAPLGHFLCLLLLIIHCNLDFGAPDSEKHVESCENNAENESCTIKLPAVNKESTFEPIGYLPVDLIYNHTSESNNHFLRDLFNTRIQRHLASGPYTRPPKPTYRIAIFNSFDFHFEMFGYIIYYAMYCNYQLTVYTNLKDKYGWVDFYNAYFQNSNSFNNGSHLVWKNYSFYPLEKHEYDVTIVPTDDDSQFLDAWADSKTIAVDHLPFDRKPSVSHHITVRPMRYTDPNAAVIIQTDRRKIKFLEKPWALPCFPILSWQEKEFILRHEVPPGIINVAIVGGYQYFYNKINRLRADNPSINKIILYLFSRGDDRVFKDQDKFGKHLTVHMYHSVSTEFLHSVLRKCHYVFTDNSPPGGFQEQGIGMSGSVPLSFAYLAPLILSRYNNALYRFKTAFEFDVNAQDSVRIVLNATKVLSKLQTLSKERSKLVSMFHVYMDNILMANTSTLP